ncbi:histone-lysine N-methyltransferase 2C-like [Octopus bimaculoides]|uniref:histone-lysine N-methyltransferase 2C-like n=1 Tax=Octopus bimaculoides TaxID=37653 RepID=UPI0022DFFB8A|nr:histone-lysine N-methyltransferase 2C-like [Octopus bimaculoides]
MAMKKKQRSRPKKTDPQIKHPSVARLLALGQKSDSSLENEDTCEKDMEISTEIKGSDMDSDSVFRSSQSTVISQYDEIKMEEGNGEEMIKKKRQRKQLGLGVGGFIVRQRNVRLTASRQSPSRQVDVNEDLLKSEIGNTIEGSCIDEGPSSITDSSISGLMSDKIKKRRRQKRKSQLEDSFPSYLQEAFFGKMLLDKCKDSKEKLDSDSEGESAGFSHKYANADIKDLCEETPIGPSSPAPGTNVSEQSEEMQPIVDEGDLKELLPADLLSSELQNDFLKIIGDDLGTSSVGCLIMCDPLREVGRRQLPGLQVFSKFGSELGGPAFLQQVLSTVSGCQSIAMVLFSRPLTLVPLLEPISQQNHSPC